MILQPTMERSSLGCGESEMQSSRTRRGILIAAASQACAAAILPRQARAASARDIAQSAAAALARLYTDEPNMRALGERAKAILVFPEIVKAGFLIGGQTGSGAVLERGNAIGYYKISSVSFGLQAGAQAFSYAIFFMTDSALQYLETSQGWSIGSGPSIVLIDKGTAASVTSATLTQDIYAVPFGQKGLMAGLSLKGSKISQIHPSN